MTLSDIASIGSLVSGVAVLISLVYLNVQTRQTVRNQQSLMQQGRSQQLIDWLQYIAQPEMADIMLGGNEGTLNVTQYVQYNSIVWSMLVSYENNFVQHRAGMLDDAQYAATLGSLKFQCSLPGFRANWALTRRTFDRQFASFVDETIRATPATLNIAENSHAAWTAAAAREAGKSA